MRAHIPRTLLHTTLMVTAVAIFHCARPLAVYAQSQATLTASATVVHADAAWTGHELTRAVLDAAAEGNASSPTWDVADVAGIEPPSGGSAVRTERNGTVVWVRTAPAGDRPTLVTVAHLGS